MGQSGAVSEFELLDACRNIRIGLVEPLNVNGVARRAHTEQQRPDAERNILCRDAGTEHQSIPFPRRILNAIDPIAKVEDIGIGARATGQDIDPSPADQGIIARLAEQDIVAGIASEEVIPKPAL